MRRVNPVTTTYSSPPRIPVGQQTGAHAPSGLTHPSLVLPFTCVEPDFVHHNRRLLPLPSQIAACGGGKGDTGGGGGGRVNTGGGGGDTRGGIGGRAESATAARVRLSSMIRAVSYIFRVYIYISIYL